MLSKALKAVSAMLLLTSASASELPQKELKSAQNPDEKLAFVFELVRHGARTPIEDRDIDKFTVGEGLLTPEGMRQRYLLGRHNRERYVEEFELLSKSFVPGEIYMQSTCVNRTMVSGYSELMGLYPPSNSDETLTKPQMKAVNDYAAPPFKVRDLHSINDELRYSALPNRYVQVPITLYNNDDIRDDVSTDGCHFVRSGGSVREHDSTIWDQYDWMVEGTEGPIEAAFGVSQEDIDSITNWHDYQVMTDTAVSLDFEGQPIHETYFSDDQWELNNEFQKVWLTDDYSKDMRDLMISRILRKPMKLMKYKVANILGVEGIPSLSDEEKDLKFVMYSAHDTQIVNMMDFLQKDFPWTPYASTVIFELKYSEKCLAAADGQDSMDCFGVSVSFNGTPQLLEGCSGDGFTLEGCSFNDFLTYIDDRWYSGPNADDLDAACANNP